MNKKWKYVPFSNIFEWGAKSNIKSGEGLKSGKFNFFVCSDIDIKRYNEYQEDRESLIFGTGGKASCHHCQEPFAYSTDCVVAHTNRADILLKFVYYFLRQNNMLLLQKGFKGSGLQHISKKYIESINIPIIEYLEQKRIVGKIEELFSELDNGVETLKKTKQQLTVYRQAVLKETFDSTIECEMGTIQSICSNIVDCPHSTPKWVDNGKICLRTTNFKRGYLDLTEKNYVSEETFDKRNARLIPQPGDVLYSREGAILGIACMIPKNLFVCLGQRMMLLRTNERMLGHFLMYYLNSPAVTSFVNTKIGGSASPHVNVGDIKEFKVPIPSIDIQRDIVKRIDSHLSVCEHIEKTVDTALQQAEAMRQSILKKAFEGEL